MIKTTFESKDIADKPVKRFVGPAIGGGYRWCEQNLRDTRYDLRQGTCAREDLPEAIAAACDAYDGCFYACEWPK